MLDCFNALGFEQFETFIDPQTAAIVSIRAAGVGVTFYFGQGVGCAAQAA